MKRWLLFSLLACLLIFLAACGGDDEETDENVEADEVTQEESEEDEQSDAEDELEEELDEADESAEGTEDEGETAASSDQIDPSVSEEELMDMAIAVLEDNLEAAEEEDIDRYMDAIATPMQTEQNREATLELFEYFDIEYEIFDIEFLFVSHDEAVVEVTQKHIATYVADGYQYQNNQVRAVHTLIAEDGEFKIFTSEILDETAVALDEDGNVIE